jgi:hypothetical protein
MAFPPVYYNLLSVAEDGTLTPYKGKSLGFVRVPEDAFVGDFCRAVWNDNRRKLDWLDLTDLIVHSDHASYTANHALKPTDCVPPTTLEAPLLVLVPHQEQTISIIF